MPFQLRTRDLNTPQRKTPKKKTPKKTSNIPVRSMNQSTQAQSSSSVQTNSVANQTTMPGDNGSNGSQDGVAFTGFRSVHMPAFKPDDINAWFRRVEHWFNLQRITREEDRYSFLASQIDHPAVSYMSEWTTQPTENPYTVVKKKMIAIFEDSTQTRIQKLLEQKPLGDMKPSLMLAEMRNVAIGVDDTVLRNLWLNRLPPAAKSVITILSNSTLDEAAKAADDVMETVNNASKINQISTESATISELKSTINSLAKAIESMNTNNSRGRSQSRSNEKSNQRSSSKAKDDNGICRFHRKFGADARRCFLPCNFSKDNSSNSKN